MLRSFVEYKLNADFLIIEDTEYIGGQHLFMCFLQNIKLDNSVKEIHIICCENPPAFYNITKRIKNKEIHLHDFFSDPCGWNDPSAPKHNLHMFTSNPIKLSEAALFIDSLSILVERQGFFATCRHLSVLKKFSKKVFCLVHGDVFSLEQLEDLSFIASAYIKLADLSTGKSPMEKLCHITHKKAGGKVIKNKESFLIGNDFEVICTELQERPPSPSDVKVDIENLSTFKVGLKISVKEKKARDELVLPYLKTQSGNKSGCINYEEDHFDDPDADLDI